MFRPSTPRTAPLQLLLAALCLPLVGCYAQEAVYFSINQEGEVLRQATNVQEAEIVDALYAAFGYPDDPYLFPEVANPSSGGLDLKKIRLASGPAWNETEGQRGLFRVHCAHCHGVTGDGNGPTAVFLNPYPRDYRQGKFKWKSTERAAMPTDEDLHRVLIDGVPGTAMPSFMLLPQDERDALVEYVKYLAVRGQVETQLYSLVVDEEEQLTRDIILETVQGVVARWSRAEDQIIEPGPRNEEISLAESIKRGQALFLDAKRTKCAGCHGPTALGDGSSEPGGSIDDWNKGKFNDAGQVDPNKADYYALPPQILQPRNLRLGIYRGGRRPVDIYRRLHAGINGAPMPAFSTSLKSEEIWNLVDFVMSLPYEQASQDHLQVTGVERERN